MNAVTRRFLGIGLGLATAASIALAVSPFTAQADPTSRTSTRPTPAPYTVVINASTPNQVLIPTVDRYYAVTLTANGITNSCREFCDAAYYNGLFLGKEVGSKCPADCMAPGSAFNAIVYRVGNGPWHELDVTTKISTTSLYGISVAFNDDNFTDNYGSYLLTVTHSKK